MSHDTYELAAEARERVGKGSARAIRRNGQVPAVIYGENRTRCRSSSATRKSTSASTRAAS
jgi:ribosomal protein L25 (general stress protein Ctc)